MCLIRVDVGKFKFSFAASGLFAWEYKLKNASQKRYFIEKKTRFSDDRLLLDATNFNNRTGF